MEMPPEISLKNQNNKVCWLKKSLYGLKQSPRAWFGRFSQAMLKTGYKKCHSDHTLFVKRNGSHITILIVYIRDIFVTSNDVEEVKRLKVHLRPAFEIKDLGALRYFLGIDFSISIKGIVICQ